MTTPLGVDPIPGDKPAGGSARYEPEFEQLEAEISKLGNPAGGEVRWPQVVELARSILAGKSKDMLVAAYYSFGLMQQQGLQGLLEGIKTLNGMCQTHWEGLFPEMRRLRARDSALDWLIDRVTAQLEKSPAGPDEGPVLQQTVAVWEAMAAFVNPKLETPNPKLPAFSRALASAGAGQAAADTAAGGGEVAGTQTTTTQAAAGPAGPITNRKVAFERLREVAEFLKRTEPHSPVAYLVNRAIKWGDMSLEAVIAELVKNNDVRKQVYETLGLKQEPDNS